MIYTAITGNKDALRDDVKCFTNDCKFDNPRLNARMVKVLPYLFLTAQWLKRNTCIIKDSKKQFGVIL